MYIFVKPKDRTDKNVGARPIRAIFVGMDHKVRGAIRAAILISFRFKALFTGRSATMDCAVHRKQVEANNW